MVKIKICGLKRLEDIELVNKYKPDYIGFVFADSKRKVSHDLAGKLKIIKAIEMSEDTDLLSYDSSNADYLLLDSGKGSGNTFDWRLIRKDLKKEFFLAGGLNSSNVIEAIDEFNPYAIDLSSSLETDGFKDENKIKEIMEVINWVKEDMVNMVVNTYPKH